MTKSFDLNVTDESADEAPGVEFEPAADDLDTDRDRDRDGTEERKPCGEYHPLPCGMDVDCADVDDDELTKQDVREIVKEMVQYGALEREWK